MLFENFSEILSNTKGQHYECLHKSLNDYKTSQNEIKLQLQNIIKLITLLICLILITIIVFIIEIRRLVLIPIIITCKALYHVFIYCIKPFVTLFRYIKSFKHDNNRLFVRRNINQ